MTGPMDPLVFAKAIFLVVIGASIATALWLCLFIVVMRFIDKVHARKILRRRLQN